MAATDTTRLIIELQTVLRGLNQTLRGLDQVKKKLDSLAAIKPTSTASSIVSKQAVATQRLADQQQRAQQTTDRLQASSARLSKALNQQQDRHVQAFRAIEKQRAAVFTLDKGLAKLGGTLRNLGLGLTSLGSALTLAFTTPIAALGVFATRSAVTLDSLKRGLTAITGSADEANQQLARLTEIAKLPGIGFQEAIQGSIRLQAVGFSAEKAEKALREFSNAVALTGGGRAELDRITVQLGQLSAKGKVLSQDLKPIIEAGPAVGRALREAFGTVNAEDIQALGLTSEQFLDKLVSQLEKLPRAAGGVRNAFDNFSDAIFRASAAVGEAIIPVLTKFIETVEPIVTRLAAGFRELPPIIQTLIVAFGGLLAGVGPLLFIVGQFATGIGGILSAVGRLIALIRLLLPALSAVQAAAAGLAITVGSILTITAAVIGLAAVLFLLSRKQKEAIQITREQIAATDAQIASIENQIKFVDSLTDGVARTAEQQRRLTETYADLNKEAKIRVTAAGDETQQLAALRAELERLLKLRQEERIQQAANLAASLANTAQQLQSSEQERNAIAARVKANAELSESLRRSGQITAEQSTQLAKQGINASTAEDAIGALNAENENLIDSQGDLIKSAKELNGTAEEQAATLRVLEQQTGLSARELLTAAKAMGVFKGNIDEALDSMQEFLRIEEDIPSTTNQATNALLDQAGAFISLGKAAQKQKEADEDVLKGMLNFFGSIARSRAEFNAFVDDALKKFPELQKAIDRLRKEQGFADAFDKLIGKSHGKSGTSLRNAEEQLAKAIEDVATASAEKQGQIERDKNDTLLDENENAFRLQLTAYRQYLNQRAVLTRQNIELEINEQTRARETALGEQQRFLDRSRKQGIPPAERTRAAAEAVEAERKAIEAESKILGLREQQKRVTIALGQALAEAERQQVTDIRKLEVEYAELTSRIQDSLDTATVEKFRERLLALAKAQDDLNKRLQDRRTLVPEEIEQLERARDQNQAEIDLIHSIAEQEFATNKLAAAQELVRQAKERQAQLEQDLAFEVEFRGLKEEEAIRKRLEGEQRLADSLRVVRDLIQAEVEALNARGVKPPQALLDFVREASAAIKGLGELPFTEQFRLVEQEFNRINDERLQKIADIERAVRERDIAEAEGLLLIRRINGQYSADLEQQLALLKQIAAQSNDLSLQRQAQSAEETVKDANSQLATFLRQLRSASIDSLQDSFTDFFVSLTDRTKTAKEKLLDLVNSLARGMQRVIAENLSRKLVESLLGDGTEGWGIIARAGRLVGRLFGRGQGRGAEGGIGAAASFAQQTGATTAAATLQTGATVAATTLTTGAATAGSTLIASLTAAAASFSASVIAAGAAFAASVAASSAAQTVSQGLGGLGSGLAAATGIFPAIPGGAVRIVEGGYPEAVLTTDPRHAARQVEILKTFLRETRGLGGRIRGLAAGGFTDRIDITPPSVSLSNAGLGELAVAGAPSTMRIRQVLVDQRDLRNWVTSSEGERVLVDFLNKNQPVIRKLSSK